MNGSWPLRDLVALAADAVGSAVVCVGATEGVLLAGADGVGVDDVVGDGAWVVV